jgi:hypothetical protein
MKHRGFESIPGQEGNIEIPAPILRTLGAERGDHRGTGCRPYLHTIKAL